MRRTIAAAGLAAAITLSPALTYVATAAPSTTVQAVDDEPASNDGEDDTGKYGLIGLSGLLGLFGYKKYRDIRATRATGTGTDGPGSRRVT